MDRALFGGDRVGLRALWRVQRAGLARLPEALPARPVVLRGVSCVHRVVGTEQ